MAVNNFAPAEYGGYVLGANGGGGGGGTGIQPLAVWNVTISSVPVNDNPLTVNYLQGENDNGTYLGIGVVDENKIYTYYSIPLDDGITDRNVSIAVFGNPEDFDGTTGFYCDEIENCHPVVTGDITFNDDYGWFFAVSGDGTIDIVTD